MPVNLRAAIAAVHFHGDFESVVRSSAGTLKIVKTAVSRSRWRSNVELDFTEIDDMVAGVRASSERAERARQADLLRPCDESRTPAAPAWHPQRQVEAWLDKPLHHVHSILIAAHDWDRAPAEVAVREQLGQLLREEFGPGGDEVSSNRYLLFLRLVGSMSRHFSLGEVVTAAKKLAGRAASV